MKRKFVGGKPPLFGTKRAPKSINYLYRSPWYWWFEYLKRNQDYLKTCARPRRGPCSAIYQDFGDVRTVAFKDWWTKGDRGAQLFGEPELAQRVEVITTTEQLRLDGSTLVLQLPLNVAQKYLKRRVAQLLRKAHGGRRGAPSLRMSRAKYRIHGKSDPRALAVALAVYDERMRSPKKALWQIGQELQVIQTREGLIKPNDPKATVRDKRTVLAVITSRYLRRARRLIENVGYGRFPDYA